MDLQLTGNRVLRHRWHPRHRPGRSSRPSSTRAPWSAFCARTAEEVAATQEALPAAARGDRGAVDVGDAAALAAWVAAAADAFGGLDVVVANVSALAIPERRRTGRPASTST